MPLEMMKGRFFWWLKALRISAWHHLENIWLVERQKRGAFHMHSVVGGVPSDPRYRKKAKWFWETDHSDLPKIPEKDDTNSGCRRLYDAKIELYDKDQERKLN